MSGGDHGTADGTWFESSLAPYYIIVSLGSLAALAASHWRYRRNERENQSLFRFPRSEEHTSELQSLMRISYAVFCLKKKTYPTPHTQPRTTNKQKNNP